MYVGEIMNDMRDTINGMEAASYRNKKPHGIPLADYTDVKGLQHIVGKLWSLLDDIDTADDIAKENDKFYRQLAFKAMVKRLNYVTSDGFDLTMNREFLRSAAQDFSE